MKRLIGVICMGILLAGCETHDPDQAPTGKNSEDDVIEEVTEHVPTKDNPLVIEDYTIISDSLSLTIDEVDHNEDSDVLTVDYTVTNHSSSPVALSERVRGNLSTGELLTTNLRDVTLAADTTQTYTSSISKSGNTHMDWFVIGKGDNPNIQSLMIVLP